MIEKWRANYWLMFAFAFAAMFTLDVLWVFFTKTIVEQKIFIAAFTNSGIVLMNAILAITVVRDWRMVVPAVIGAWCGTVTSLTWYGPTVLQ